jgi:nucleotide-binding universal stress UspA family protein
MPMYSRILVPLDGSEVAELALVHAMELALKLDLEVVMLHVYEPDEGGQVAMREAYMERVAERMRRGLQMPESKDRQQEQPPSMNVRTSLIEGHTAEQIVRYAETNGIDVIVMATHGYSGIKRWRLGSVADKVLRASSIPIWLVRAQGSGEVTGDVWPGRRVLVPLDGSELAESVLPHVQALAKQKDGEPVEVVLVGVCEPMLLPSYYPPDIPLNWDHHIALCKRSSGEYLSNVVKRLKNAGVNARSEVLVGKAADAIIDFANEQAPNVIAIATHGRSGVSRWAFGSVAERVLRGVSGPVFLVRPVHR